MRLMLTIFLFILTVNVSFGHSKTDFHTHTEEEIAQELIECSDCRNYAERAALLSKEMIYYFAESIRAGEHMGNTRRAIAFTAIKYKQFESELPEETKEEIVETALGRISKDIDYFMDFSSTHNALIDFNHPLVLEFAKAHIDSENPRITFGCGRIIKNYKNDGTLSLSPSAPELVGAAEGVTSIKLAIEESAVVESTEEPIEKPSNWWLWLIGLLVVVGGFLVVRRKS